MSIKGTSNQARVTTGDYIGNGYVPPTTETPESANYTRDLNVAPVNVEDHVYERDFNTSLDFGDGYVYNFGPPGSPHERWGATAQRSAAYAPTGLRWSGDIISSGSTSAVNHEVDDLPTVKPLPGYH